MGKDIILAIFVIAQTCHAGILEGWMMSVEEASWAELPVERYTKWGNLGGEGDIGAAASVGGGWRHGLRRQSEPRGATLAAEEQVVAEEQRDGTDKSLASSATDGQFTRETIEQQVTKRMDDPEFEKYAKDHRRFRYIEMKNGAKAFLVSDEKAKRAGMALTFGRGHISEPPGTSGFAHLMEHSAVYMGTKRLLDKEDAEGAITAGETTANTVAFTADCNPPDLMRLFPIMAENLRKATYNKDIVMEQNLSIDNETWMNKPNRISQKTLSAFFDDHPAVRICADSSALPIDETVAKLKDMHDRYVRSDKIAVLLVGHDSLDEMEAIAVKGLRNYERSRDANRVDEAKVALSRLKNERWFTDEHLGKLVMYAPHWAKEGEHQTVAFYFRVEEPTRGYWPMSLFTTLALHDKVGRIPGVWGLDRMYLSSLFEYASSLVPETDMKQSILAIPVRLSSNYDDTTIQEVGDTIFSSLHWLRQQDAPVWWSDELISAAEATRLSKTDFEDQNPADDNRLPYRILENIELINLPLGHLEMDLVRFGAPMWNSFLNNLRVDNMFVMVGGTRWEPKCDKQLFRDKDKWGVTDLNSEWRKSWQAHEDGVKKVPSYDEFRMPPPDPFIPTSFNIKEVDPNAAASPQVPVKVDVPESLADKLNVYWSQPAERESSKIGAVLRISSGHLDGTAATYAESYQFADYFSDAVDSSLGHTAEWRFLIHASADGAIGLSLEAEAHVFDALLKTVTRFLSDFRATPEILSAADCGQGGYGCSGMEDDLVYALDNDPEFSRISSDIDRLRELMTNYGVQITTATELSDHLLGLPNAHLPRRAPKVFETAHIDMIIVGNLTKEDAIRYGTEAVASIGIRHGCPRAPMRSRFMSVDKLVDEAGRPLRLRTKRTDVTDDEARRTFTLPHDEEHDAFLALCWPLSSAAWRYFNDETTIAYSQSDASPIDEDLIRLGIGFYTGYHVDKIERHVPKAVSDILQKHKEETTEEWFDKAVNDKFRDYENWRKNESVLDRAEMFMLNLRRGKAFTREYRAEIGLKKLTYQRFKEIRDSLEDQPGFLSQALTPRKKATGKDYPGELSVADDRRPWLAVGTGTQWNRDRRVKALYDRLSS